MSTTQKKGKSLSDLLDEQVDTGVLNASERDSKVDWNRGRSKPSTRAPRQQQAFSRSRGNNSYNNSPAWSQKDYGSGGNDNTLNWQQEQMQQQGGQQKYQQQGYQQQGYQQQGYQQQGYQQQGYQQQGYQQRGQRNNPQRGGFPTRQHDDDTPAWAADVPSSNANSDPNQTLNWQQQSLMTRDEDDPFLKLNRIGGATRE